MFLMYRFISKVTNRLHSNKKHQFICLRNIQVDHFNAPNYISFGNGFMCEKEKNQLVSSMQVFENFVSEEEETSLLEELEPYLKKMKYESDHWDNAIRGYRETEKLNWIPVNYEIIKKVKKLAFEPPSVPLEPVHILDLDENGVIMPHIDSIKFCGTTIAGLSLLSHSVMRLIHDKDKYKILDVFLKRRSLYIMTGVARYNYTHEILGNENSIFASQVIKKGRRISIICRNEP